MLEEFNKINNPQELYEFILKNINYGIKGYLAKETNDHLDKWKLNTELELLNNPYGLCFDYVELERYWFQKHNFEHQTIFIYFALEYENEYSTHSTLIYKQNNKWYHFEVANHNNQGIHEFNTYQDTVSYIINEFIKYNQTLNNYLDKDLINKIKLFTYPKPDNNLNFSEYIDYIINNGTEI